MDGGQEAGDWSLQWRKSSVSFVPSKRAKTSLRLPAIMKRFLSLKISGCDSTYACSLVFQLRPGVSNMCKPALSKWDLIGQATVSVHAVHP